MQQKRERMRSRQRADGPGARRGLGKGPAVRRRMRRMAYGTYVHQWRALPAAAYARRAGRPAVPRTRRASAKPTRRFNTAMPRG
ncbi:hypothetical protein O1L60_38585 [Streptomyces diastatochromogenes]|nr:hypothetical protein [Streptomyces diastatochromogenes]